MGLMSPVEGSGKAGSRSRRSVRVKTLIAAGSVALGLAGYGLTVATPASADPAVQFVTTGSDTTQFIIDNWALRGLGSGVVASYDATNPQTGGTAEVITPTKVVPTTPLSYYSCSFTRPNGSGQGLNALRYSLNPSTAAPSLPNGLNPQNSASTSPTPAGTYCVDFSRSSSSPDFIGQGTAKDTSGQLVFIPFAFDTFAMFAGSGLPDADSFTTQNLKDLYACSNVTIGTNTYSPSHDAGDIPIDMMIPQSGSGTRAWWAFNIGGTLTPSDNADLNSCTKDTIQAGPLQGTINEENTGFAYASDPDALGPMSVANFVAMAKGAEKDNRDGEGLHPIDGIAPTTGSGATLALNPGASLNREVYNVAAYDRVVDTGDGNFDAALSGLLAGTTSRLCTSASIITGLGFRTLNPGGGIGTDTCGSTAGGLRIQPSTGSGYSGV